jgi:hypothetical protein
MKINEKLMNIQRDLKAPKNQYNAFGKYKYRSCEDILEAVKPLLVENKMTLVISDSIEGVNQKNYVKATVVLTDVENGDKIESAAYAREADNKKGMDDSQITGATSSYARKYALNGLFGIDDSKDADSTNTHGKEAKSKPTKKKSTKTVSEDEILEIEKLISDVGVDKAKFQKWLKSKYNASKIDDIPQVNYAKVISVLESKKEDK